MRQIPCSICDCEIAPENVIEFEGQSCVPTALRYTRISVPAVRTGSGRTPTAAALNSLSVSTAMNGTTYPANGADGSFTTTKSAAPTMTRIIRSSWFHDFIQKTDLPQIHIHSLRHTNATLSIANGVAVTTVAGQLGHANATTMAKIYVHSIKSAQAAAAEMMDDLLSPTGNKKIASGK